MGHFQPPKVPMRYVLVFFRKYKAPPHPKIFICTIQTEANTVLPAEPREGFWPEIHPFNRIEP